MHTFFSTIERNGGEAWVKYYRLGPKVDPKDIPWECRELYLEKDQRGDFCLVTLKDTDWAEFHLKYDVQEFNGTHIILINEDYALEIESVAGHRE